MLDLHKCCYYRFYHINVVNNRYGKVWAMQKHIMYLSIISGIKNSQKVMLCVVCRYSQLVIA